LTEDSVLKFLIVERELPLIEDEVILLDFEGEETSLLEGYVFKLEVDRMPRSILVRDPRVVLDTFPEKGELLSGVLKVDDELESVFLPIESERIDLDDRDTEDVRLRDCERIDFEEDRGEALPDLKPLLTCRRDDRVKAFLAAAVTTLSAFRIGLIVGCLADKDIFPIRDTWLRPSATFEMRRAWS
jgi:hypothetical protein